MVEINVEHVHPFVKALEAKGMSLIAYGNPDVFACDCGCIFLPLPEGDRGWYPDRYEHMVEGSGCGSPCACHEIGYMVDLNGNPTTF